MPLTVRGLLSVAAICLIGAGSPARAQSASIPEYFFSEWTVSKDCSEPHAGIGGHTQPGLKFRVSRSSHDGESFVLEAIDNGRLVWPKGWKRVKLEYRPGTKMRSIPADFECIPGEEASNPFLAMSGYAMTAEPWYEYEHWYGMVTIHGEPHHLLIFPRDVRGPSSAIVVLHDADAYDNIKLDHGGAIHVEN